MGSAETAARPTADKWIIAGTVVFGAFMAVMDVSVVNVALPHMMGSFGQSLSAITWVATSYSTAEIIMLTMAGWWAAVLGRKRLYLISFGVFTLGSILAGTAQSFEAMILYRVLQGLGGGSLIPVSQAILRETFPEEEQGMAMALYGMGVVLAPAIGPVLGGWLTEWYGWPWIFYINVPVSVVAILLTAAFVHDPPYLRRGVRRIDWFGIALLTVGLTLLQVVLERGQENNWFESQWITVCTMVTVMTLLVFTWWELRVDDPVVNLRLLKDVPLAVGSTMGLVFGIILFGSTFILPQFTQELLGYSAYQSGLVLLPRAVALFLMMPVAGMLYRFVDARVLVASGMALLGFSFWELGHLAMNVGFWDLVPLLLVQGCGMPYMFVTLSTVALSSVPRSEMTEASSLYTLARRVGGNLGYAVVATAMANRNQFHHARLVPSLSDLNPLFQERFAQATAFLIQRGYSASEAARGALLLLERSVMRQAAMMSYNDVAWLMGLAVLATTPLILLLPGRAKGRQEGPGKT